MKTNMNWLFILIIILSIGISKANSSKRNLQSSKQTLTLIKAYNLMFLESKWKFSIAYSGDITGTPISTPILYKQDASKVSCQVMSSERLDCQLTQDGQAMSDLIVISNSGANDADIEWTGLSENYYIPINATLNYEESLDLVYTSNSKKWNFRVKIKDTDVLPENGVVIIDLSLTSGKKTTANCKYSNHYLTCDFIWERSVTYLIKIIQKDSGSITWNNMGSMEENFFIIPFKSKINHYNGAYNMDLKDGNWNYYLTARIEDSIGGTLNAITINSKIVKANGGEPLYYKTRCYSRENKPSSSIYQCKVYGVGQEKTDLVYLTPKADVNEISIDWNNYLVDDEIISRNETLTFKRIYDLSYTDNTWNFKIDVENDENLPQTAKVRVDFAVDTNNYNKECTFKNHVLECNGKASYNPGSGTLIAFQSVKVAGSVTWTNLKEKYIYIPLSITLTYTGIIGSMFTNQWNFIITATNTNSEAFPGNSRVLIDILHNNEETTALCRKVKDNYFYCVSNYETQSSTDVIKIKSAKKYGSVTWSSSFDDITITKNTFMESETQMSFVDANNLNFANGRWGFNIIARSTNPDRTKKYKVDIIVTTSSGTTKRSTAYCLLYTIINNPETMLSCSCVYPDQNKDDLIMIAHQKHDSLSTSIFWKSGITATYPIALSTELIYANQIDSFSKGNNGYWTFTIHLTSNDNYILPLNSKIIVDILHTTTNKANCTATSKTILSCKVKISTSTQPTLELILIKTLDSSVLWTVQVTAQTTPTPVPHVDGTETLEFIKAYNLEFKSTKWQFSIAYSLEDRELTTGTTLTTPILYKGVSSKANCKVMTIERLDCELENDNQKNSDLIKISNSGSNDANIQWTAGLNTDYNIPINATLNYVNSYDLVYTSNSQKWDFRVKIKETDVLPEGGAVIIDLSLTAEQQEAATCIHNNHYLTCEFIWKNPNTYLVKIVQKKYGSITWDNINAIDENLFIIPFKSKITRIPEGYNLYLNEGHWIYNLIITYEGSNGGSLSSIAFNSKIEKKNSEQPLYYYTRCYLKNDYYECKVYGDNQELTDLVYISKNTDQNEISIDWNNQLTEDIIINRNAVLTFKRIYDLRFINRVWNFKIDVEDDENLPENAKVRIDIVANGNVYKPCSFQNHILTCNEKASFGADSETLITFQSVRTKGSVTWTNLKEKIIYIPLNITLTYTRIIGGMFTNQWSFIITATYSDSEYCPSNSRVLIDILHNDEETTALCRRVKDNYFYCVSNYETQSSTDVIKIISTKKYGSVTWSSSFADVSIVEGTFMQSETEMNFVDANNLNFANGRWGFNIIARSTNPDRTKKYKVDIIVKTSSGTTKKSTANCLIYILTNNPETMLSCVYADSNQNKDDLITIAYPKHDSSSLSIKWTTGITGNYPITLNTELIYANKIDNYRKQNSYWNFDVHLETNDNYILPLNSKVIIDINKKTANCTATSKTLLSCQSQINDYSQPTITLDLIKSLDSSILWKNHIEISPVPTPTPDPENTEESKTDITSEKPQPDPEPAQPPEPEKDSELNYSNYFNNIKFYLVFIAILA